MAGGWARDGAVQDQIDASVDDAVKLARSKLKSGESAKFCTECGLAIPKERREALSGIKLCIVCQSQMEAKTVPSGGINRRGSKDSQLR